MLLDSYYSIRNQRTENDTTVFDVILKPDCPIYEGHFPDMPVAPGVCNIQMIKEITERMTGKLLMLEYISQCRLTTLITPRSHPCIEVRIRLIENGDGMIQTLATIGQNGEDYFVLKGVFTPGNRI